MQFLEVKKAKLNFFIKNEHSLNFEGAEKNSLKSQETHSAQPLDASYCFRSWGPPH